MEYVFTFIEGVASFISPCILPMLPIYISYFAGSGEEKTSKKVINSIGFVIGFTIVFMALSVFASTFGKIVGANLKYIKYFFGAVVIILGLNYIGLFKIKFLSKMASLKANTKNLNFLKSILFGMIFSISWTPCIGTFLSSALLLISKQQDVIKGILLILIYSMGLGVPLVLSVILIDKLKNTFEIIKKNYNVITKISGAILVIMGVYIILF